MKKKRGFFEAMVSDADDFMMEFPPSATPEDRMLLMAAMIFMDYCYFEEGPNQGGHRRY
jgi:hypothetical protein